MTAKVPTDIKFEKRIWHLLLLAILVILFLTLMLVILQYIENFEQSEIVLLARNASKYSVFLAILILLFCAYIISQERRLTHLTRKYIREKETAEIMGHYLKTLSALFDVSAMINAQQNLSEVLNTITQEMLTCFNADRSSIMLYDPATQTLKTRAVAGKGADQARDAVIPIGEGVAGWVLQNGKPLLLNGEVNSHDFPGTPPKMKSISSAVCVPLKIGLKNIGVLSVNIADENRAFSEMDLKLIDIFSNNASVAINNALLLKEKDQRIQLQNMMEQLHSPHVVRDMIEHRQDRNGLQQMRQKKEITVLFADIRGFSNLVNALDLEQTMNFLDEFYSIMTKAVQNNGGNIDKFIGDEVMAFFGAPNILANPSENGLSTAVEMMASFGWIKEKFMKESSFFQTMGFGIGISTGEAFVGNVGSISRYDYTVIGNVVNLTRRLCTQAEAGQILTTGKTLQKISGKVSAELISNTSLKGISEPVEIYRII